MHSFMVPWFYQATLWLVVYTRGWNFLLSSLGIVQGHTIRRYAACWKQNGCWRFNWIKCSLLYSVLSTLLACFYIAVAMLESEAWVSACIRLFVILEGELRCAMPSRLFCNLISVYGGRGLNVMYGLWWVMACLMLIMRFSFVYDHLLKPFWCSHWWCSIKCNLKKKNSIRSLLFLLRFLIKKKNLIAIRIARGK